MSGNERVGSGMEAGRNLPSPGLRLHLAWKGLIFSPKAGESARNHPPTPSPAWNVASLTLSFPLGQSNLLSPSRVCLVNACTQASVNYSFTHSPLQQMSAHSRVQALTPSCKHSFIHSGRRAHGSSLIHSLRRAHGSSLIHSLRHAQGSSSIHSLRHVQGTHSFTQV